MNRIDEIEELRKKHKIKVIDLALSAGIAVSTYSKIKNKKQNASKKMLSNIAIGLQGLAARQAQNLTKLNTVAEKIENLLQNKSKIKNKYYSAAERWRNDAGHREEMQEALWITEAVRRALNIKYKEMEEKGALMQRVFQRRLYGQLLITKADLRGQIEALQKISGYANIFSALPPEFKLFLAVRKYLARRYKISAFGIRKSEAIQLDSEAIYILKKILQTSNKKLAYMTCYNKVNIHYLLKRLEKIFAEQPILKKEMIILTAALQERILHAVNDKLAAEIEAPLAEDAAARPAVPQNDLFGAKDE